MSRFLITSIGSAATDVAARTLTSQGHDLFGCDIYPDTWLGNSAYFASVLRAPLSADRDAYVQFLLSACRENSVNYLLPLTDIDVEQVASMKESLTSESIVACAPDPGIVDVCRDKAMLARFVERLGHRAIDTELAHSPEAERMEFPRILKPRRGRSSQGNVVVDSTEGFDYASGLRGDYVVQPFLRGTYYTVDVVRDRFGTVAAIPRRELLRTRDGLGTTVEVFRGGPLVQVVTDVAHALDLVGVVNIEFIGLDSGEFRLMEINPRLSGGVAFSHLAGYDVVTNAISAFSGTRIAEADSVRGCTVARRFIETVTTESEA